MEDVLRHLLAEAKAELDELEFIGVVSGGKTARAVLALV
jgi:hypothetical protein